ncbi:MAG: glycosyltransferase [Chitinophagaceae bacterium]|jgi:cellulose synthase/poly-beta-1,6-N-acetylglucosamine synthase-like glycosyltransferase
MVLYCIGWNLQKEFNYSKIYQAQTKISVVIAARNESANIQKCLNSILAQNYPAHLFEIILVDDHSTDNTAGMVRENFGEKVKIVSLSDFIFKDEKVISFKKRALAVGIEQSEGALIVTTDADCWMGEKWLSTIAKFYETHSAEMIVAPVRFSSDRSLLQLFQSLDFLTMQGITVATIRLRMGIMCNGANLAFSRAAFSAVNGYDGVDHLISGDDYLLQSKIKQQYPDGVLYLKSKDAIVNTLPQESWAGFFNQRIRWASKTGKYKDPIMTVVLSMVYLFNLGLFISFVAGFVQFRFFMLFCIAGILKILFELIFLFDVSRFFNRQKQLFYFPFFQPLHIIYIILAGFLSRLGTFSWKQRSVKQN